MGSSHTDETWVPAGIQLGSITGFVECVVRQTTSDSPIAASRSGRGTASLVLGGKSHGVVVDERADVDPLELPRQRQHPQGAPEPAHPRPRSWQPWTPDG